VYSTSMFASLPNHSTFMVKERQKDSSGVTRVKLALKSSVDQRYNNCMHSAKLYSINYIITVCSNGMVPGNLPILYTSHMTSLCGLYT